MRQKENTKWHPIRLQSLIVFFSLLVLISLACNLPSSLPLNLPGQADFDIQTSVAGTLVALEADQVNKGTDSEPEGTQTPGDPTTMTPTTASLSAGDVKVFVSENTNCRAGQGTTFERLTILLKGEEAEVAGVDTSGDYWYIRRPDKLTEFCWLWGRYATPTGPYDSVPVFTQVPTATPGFEFEITYHSNLGLCGGLYVLQYRIANTGSFTLESWQTSAVDHTGGSNPQVNQQNKFIDNTGCVPVGEKVNLAPGESYFVNALFNNNPAGHDITVTVQICSSDGLGGICRSRTIRHTP
jgi:hypothetical protein